jgi:hypothetical protein
VIAHGFAGSRQLMAAWQLTLAQAGYVTASFDFEGHGRNPVPMSGDVTSIDGTTQLLMDEIGRVTDAALEATGAAPRVALLGHSMASDIVVRQGIRDDRVEAIVGISLFSQAVTEAEPRNLLIINGGLEGMLREAALEVMAPLGVGEGETVGTPGDGFARRAVSSPFVEHVGVLYAPTGLGRRAPGSTRASAAPIADGRSRPSVPRSCWRSSVSSCWRAACRGNCPRARAASVGTGGSWRSRRFRPSPRRSSSRPSTRGSCRCWWPITLRCTSRSTGR